MSLTIAEQGRLRLRRLDPNDAEIFFALNADPRNIEHTGDEPFESLSAARDFLEKYQRVYADHDEMGRWAVELIQDRRVIGFCGLRRQPEGDVDLGYRLFYQEWGKGYATEASKLSLDLAFSRFALTHVIARARSANPASVRVMQKLGMSFRGPFDDEGHPGVIYEMSASAWRALSAQNRCS